MQRALFLSYKRYMVQKNGLEGPVSGNNIQTAEYKQGFVLYGW